jgi:2-(1,2-epoxy-1,2-dihydrophenyl)acetyl-CoA isomerase
MSEESVVVTREGAVAVVRLNEPKTFNAMSPTLRAAMVAHVPGLVGDPAVRAIVVTGTGAAFCAGGDIRNMTPRDPLGSRKRLTDHYRWAAPLIKSGKPVITAVNGVAAGAGMSLALIGDIILASRDSYFMTAFTRLGACPDLALLATLPRAIGMVRARDLLMTSRKVEAQEAWNMGLVSRVVEPSSLMATAMEVAGQLAAGPTVTFGLIKQLLLRAYDPSIDNFLEVEAFGQAMAQSTDDFVAGAEAFLAKRKPTFQGR